VRAYRTSIAVLSAIFVVLGFALLFQTARAGGGVGYVFGALFIALGTGRLWLLRAKK
jgi:dipeptide/tripeptide permease